MDYSFTSSLNPNIFDEFSLQHPLTSFFQSTAWPKVKTEWEPIYTGVYQGSTLVAASLVLKRNLPLNLAIFYLPRGPLLDYDNVELLKFYFSNLKQLAAKNKAIFIKFDPNIIIASEPLKTNIVVTRVENHNVVDNLKQLGIKHLGFNLDMYETYQPRFSAMINYQEYDVKSSRAYRESIKAMKKGVEVTTLTYDDLDILTGLLHETEKRQNVSLRDLKYFQGVYNAFNEDVFLSGTKLNLKEALLKQEENLNLLNDKLLKTSSLNAIENIEKQISSLKNSITKFKDEIQTGKSEIFLSAQLAIKHGPTCELLYAGSDTSYGRYYASYLSNISAIQWGMDRGCKTCNLGGLPGYLDDGLTNFKSSFNLDVIQYIGEFDLPVNKITANLFRWAYPFLRKIRKYILKD